jgi:hypothetical protein
MGAAILLMLGSHAVLAQDDSIYRGTLLGGLGGSFLSEGKHDPDHSVLQASLGILTDDRTFTVFRVGKIGFGDQEIVAGRSGAELEYVNVAGEYRLPSRAYTWGFFLGVGGYRLTGDALTTTSRRETALGLALGVEGDFDLTRHLGLAVEFGGHYVFFDEADLYGVGLVGLAIHF